MSELSSNYLTIALPTYNRARKLDRLLGALREQVIEAQAEGLVTILISDNFSSDDTRVVAEEWCQRCEYVRYHRQEKNLGFDGNILSLYTMINSTYLWYFADDDIPFKGALARVLRCLHEHQPDALVFSFSQPPGSGARQYHFSSPVEIVDDPRLAIRYADEFPKVSKYVLRVYQLEDSERLALECHLGDGFMYLPLTYTAFLHSAAPRLAVISEPLAGCDSQFLCDVSAEWADWMLRMHKSATHPFVVRHLPHFQAELRDRGYVAAIQFVFADAVGAFGPTNSGAVRKYTRILNWRWSILTRSPRLFLQLLVLKVGIAGFAHRMYRRLNPSSRRPESNGK